MAKTRYCAFCHISLGERENSVVEGVQSGKKEYHERCYSKVVKARRFKLLRGSKGEADVIIGLAVVVFCFFFS